MYFKKRNNTSLNKDIATIREYLSRVGDLSATNGEIEDKYAEFSKGKNNYDKRHALKEKQTKRDIARSIKQY